MLEPPLSWLVAAVVGYLLGSISFARLAARVFAGGQDISRTSISSPRTGEHWEVHGNQASSLTGRASWQVRLGVVLLDMAKAGIPTYILRVSLPDDPAYAIAFAAAVIGHNWPIYHGFLGGFGISSIIGGTLAIDPLALVVTIPIGVVVGKIFLDQMSMINGFVFLLPVWFVVVDPRPEAVAASIVVIGAYWIAKRTRLTHTKTAPTTE